MPSRAAASGRAQVRIAPSILAPCLLLLCLGAAGCTSPKIGPAAGQGAGYITLHNAKYFAWNPLTARAPSYGRKLNVWPSKNHYQMWGSIPGVEAREVARGQATVDRESLIEAVGSGQINEFIPAAGEGGLQRSTSYTVEYVAFAAAPNKVLEKLNQDAAALDWLRRAENPAVVLENVVLLKQESLKKLAADGRLEIKVLPEGVQYGGQLAISASGSNSVRHVLGAPVIWAYKIHRVVWSADKSRIIDLRVDLPGSLY